MMRIACCMYLSADTRSMDPEGHVGQGVRTPPPKNRKNIVCFSNTGPDPWTNNTLPSQHSMTCHHRPTSETPFKWRFANRSKMVHAPSGI